MKYIILFITLFVTLASNAQKIVEIENIGGLIINDSHFSNYIQLCKAKKNTYFIQIRKHFIMKQSLDKIEVIFNNGDSLNIIPLEETVTRVVGRAKTGTYTAHTSVSRVGNIVSANTYITADKVNVTNDFKIYPITIEQYNRIKEIGIKDIILVDTSYKFYN